MSSKLGGSFGYTPSPEAASRNAGNRDPTFRAVAVKDGYPYYAVWFYVTTPAILLRARCL